MTTTLPIRKPIGFVEKHDLQGFTRGAPSIVAAQIDGKIADESRCPECHGMMSYSPWVHKTTRSYRAFAVCGRCGYAIEF